MRKICLIFITFFSLTPNLSYGAGAYLVDDGGIVDVKTLQVENWYNRSNHGEDIFVSDPAYQLLPNAEFSIQETYNESAANNTLWPQVKYRWFNNKNIQSSFTTGVNYSSSQQKTYGAYAYSSSTFRLNEITDIHLYLGWQNWRHATRNDNKSTDFLNYGLGTEIHFDQKLSLTGEFFQQDGLDATKPALQIGSRYVVSKHLILDAIFGKNITFANQNWFTLGVSLWF